MVIVINTTTPGFRGELFIISLFEQLSNRFSEHDFFFITSAEISKNGAHFIKLKNNPALSDRFLKNLKYQFELKKKIKGLAPDILISPVLISGLPKTVKQYFLASYPAFQNEKQVDFKNLKMAQGIISASDSLSQILKENGISEEKIITIRPLIDVEIHDFINSHPETDLADDPFLLLIDNNPDKDRMVFILKAFSAFKKRLKSSMKLLIPAGKGSKKVLETLIKSYKYRNDVLIVTTPPLDVLANYSSNSYGVIINSDKYGFDNPTSIFVAAESVIIAVDTVYNGVKEFTGDNAFYYHSTEIEVLSDILIRLYKDEELRNRFKQIKSREETEAQKEEQLSHLSKKLFQE